MVGPNVSKTGYVLRKRSGLTTQARLPVEGEIGNLVRACVSAASKWLPLCRDGKRESMVSHGGPCPGEWKLRE